MSTFFVDYFQVLLNPFSQVLLNPSRHLERQNSRTTLPCQQLYFLFFKDLQNLSKSTTQPTCRLIAAAAQPAPKPLSILTTATPGAQLFNMPSRAAIPPKPVP